MKIIILLLLILMSGVCYAKSNIQIDTANVAATQLATVATYLYMNGTRVHENKSLRCMIENVYLEARGEDKQGKLLVAKVVLNREKLKNYPSTICNVIHQPHQFSWTSNKTVQEKYHEIDRNRTLDDGELQQSVWVSFYTVMFSGNVDSNAIAYYAPNGVKNAPSWCKYLRKDRVHGNHVFYAIDYI